MRHGWSPPFKAMILEVLDNHVVVGYAGDKTQEVYKVILWEDFVSITQGKR